VVVVGFAFVVVGLGGFVVVVGGFRRVRPLSRRGTLTPPPAPAPAPAPTPPVGGGVVGVVDAVALVVEGVVVTGVTDHDALDGNDDDTVAVSSPAPLTPLTTPKARTAATVPPNTFRGPKRARREPSKATATHFQTGSGEARRRPGDNRPPRHRSSAVGRSFRASAQPLVVRTGRAWLVFACTSDGLELIARRGLLERDRAITDASAMLGSTNTGVLGPVGSLPG
jgi:hypothetical protein